jgi:hypothetical protein
LQILGRKRIIYIWNYIKTLEKLKMGSVLVFQKYNDLNKTKKRESRKLTGELQRLEIPLFLWPRHQEATDITIGFRTIWQPQGLTRRKK